MKNVYYSDGPPSITAGIAGRFTQGKQRPVSDRIGALLLARPEFREADGSVPVDESQDIVALTREAQDADKADAKAAKEMAKDAAAAKDAAGQEAPASAGEGR